jgi:hypothetical protein
MGYDLHDLPMEVVFLSMGNPGDNSISGGSEGDEDDPIVNASHPRTEMGQPIDPNLGQGSHVHAKKVAIFGP